MSLLESVKGIEKKAVRAWIERPKAVPAKTAIKVKSSKTAIKVKSAKAAMGAHPKVFGGGVAAGGAGMSLLHRQSTHTGIDSKEY